MKIISDKSHLIFYACGHLIGIFSVLIYSYFSTMPVIKLSESYFSYPKIAVSKMTDDFNESSVTAAANSSDPFKCFQCVSWQMHSADESKYWTYDTFLQKHLLEILKGSLTGYSLQTDAVTAQNTSVPFNEAASYYGQVWPRFGVTMVGIVRLNSLQQMLEDVIHNEIEGDFMECGVWRGGVSIFARSVFVIYRSSKRVYVADSFAGLPVNRSERDSNSWSGMKYLAISVEMVRHNFKRFGVFDDESVIFLKGFFNETMPQAHNDIGRLSVLRMDGDMYESCFDILSHMYSHVSVMGYVIIDDWTGFPCKSAVLEIRSELGIQEPIYHIDRLAAYWQKKTERSYDVALLYQKLFAVRKYK